MACVSQLESSHDVCGLTEFDHLMISERLEADGVNKSNVIRLWNPLGSWLIIIHKLLRTRATVATVGDSEREFFSEKQIRFPPLKHVYDFIRSGARIEELFDSQKTCTVLAQFRFCRFSLLVFVLLGDDTGRTGHFINLRDDNAHLHTAKFLRIR